MLWSTLFIMKFCFILQSFPNQYCKRTCFAFKSRMNATKVSILNDIIELSFQWFIFYLRGEFLEFCVSLDLLNIVNGQTDQQVHHDDGHHHHEDYEQERRGTREGKLNQKYNLPLFISYFKNKYIKHGNIL